MPVWVPYQKHAIAIGMLVAEIVFVIIPIVLAVRVCRCTRRLLSCATAPMHRSPNALDTVLVDSRVCDPAAD
jgi:hypothetical protein